MTDIDDRSDSDLILAYGRDRDETAFEVLAARHVDMIYSVCLRRSGNRQLAEEATQNVLLSLSKKARRLSVLEKSLSGWLHKSSKFEVSKLQRRESRIKKREQIYATTTMTTLTNDEERHFEQLYPVLDQATDHLRSGDREVIVRRYLDQQSFRRIGDALGISEDAAQKRTTRAFEKLNRIFKRRAGVTISAAALAGGLAQHTAKAAPAKCLAIGGEVTSVGFGSIFTTFTITSMNISKITIVSGVVLLGSIAAFVATGDNWQEDHPRSISSSELPASTDSKDSDLLSRNGRKASSRTKRPSSEEGGTAKLEALSPHPGNDEFARRLAEKHAKLLAALIKDLGLSAEQAAAVKELLDSRVKVFLTTLEAGKQTPASPKEAIEQEKDMLTKAGSIIRGVGLREDLEGILSADQLVSYDERERKIWATQVESHALGEFARVMPALGLTEEQKDQVFDLLQDSSAQDLRDDADVRAYLALQRGQSVSQVDLTSFAEADFLEASFSGASGIGPGSPEFEQRLIEIAGDEINARVDHLSPALDENQISRYREYLVQRSPLASFGINLPTPENE